MAVNPAAWGNHFAPEFHWYLRAAVWPLRPVVSYGGIGGLSVVSWRSPGPGDRGGRVVVWGSTFPWQAGAARDYAGLVRIP